MCCVTSEATALGSGIVCCVTCERTALGSGIVCCVTFERTALGSGIVCCVTCGGCDGRVSMCEESEWVGEV